MSVLKHFEHLRIRLEVIKSATNNFAKESCIGRGGFGKVYKGELLHSKGHSMVAIKRLDRAFGQGDSEFWKELIMLSVYRHQNIVSLLGFCDEKGEKILVYEYASNRSLDLHLDNKDLTWVRRLTVCIGAARGLAYLHDPGETQQRVLHRDIKSSNILLDENWNTRIADLGLSRFGPANQKYTFLVTNNTVGTIGYCDPLYLETGLLTKESDVYSFGVVLFEVLCGRLCFGNNGSFTQLVRKHYKRNNLNEIVWGNIKDEIHPSSLKVFSTIAYRCLKCDNEKRPLMKQVVKELETALEYQLSAASVSTPTYQPGFEKLKQEKVDLREHGRHQDQYKWLETHGMEEENLVHNLPKDPRKDLKRHICVDLVKRVPLFKDMNERQLHDICQRLKPRLYTDNTYIIQEGDPVDEMLFLIRGHLESTTTYKEKNSVFNNGYLGDGDFTSEELLTWAIDPKSGANFPSSTRTLKALSEIEAFALPANQLKFIVHHFGIPQKQLQHTFRFYSKRWRTWSAFFIQTAWRRYSKRKVLKQRRMEEEAELNTCINGGGVGGTSSSVGATFLALTFAAKVILGVYRNRNLKIAREMMKLQKPPEPDFNAHAD
ncbi:hypothetical protein Lser_V15G22683 [Lactuca serriola]